MPPRNRISLEQRERIVRALEDVHEDYLAIAETIGVNRSTARAGNSRPYRSESSRRTLRGERAYREVCGQQGRNVTVALAISPTSGLVFHSAILGGMNGRRIDDFLAQTRLNLDPDEHVIFIYDGAPAYRNPAIRGPNSELRKLPPYSPFLNIVEQVVSALKAAIKADISRPEIQVQMNDRAEARREGLALGNYRTQLLLQALQKNIGTITVAKCGQWFRFMQTYLPRCINNEAIEG
ncbi:uncharacterized protein [Montipora capricornis]|uniref:uncharacterized protein n=1 Tax=Montipora capricornis TaxID=246305 RepID=UPI0035F1434C